MKNNKIIGTIDTNAGTFMFGSDLGAYAPYTCYKNPIEFRNSSDEICYIPENGAVTEVAMMVYRLDDATTYTYNDFEELIKDFLTEHYPDDAKDVLKVIEWEDKLFEACQGEDPSTIIDGWVRDIDDADEERYTLEDMQEYVSNFDWNQNTELLKKVYAMLP